MKKMTNFLVQPVMRRLFYSDSIRLTPAAARTVLQLHLALGGELSGFGECTGILDVPRGDIRDWRSFDDVVTFDHVTCRDEYRMVWAERFPEEIKQYVFHTRNTAEGLSLTVTDGHSYVLFSLTDGEYLIPTICEILKYILAEFVMRKNAI